MKGDFINEILTEWSHRIDDGKPNPKDCYHVSILSQVLYEMNLPEEFIGEFISNLNTEQGNVCEVSFETSSMPIYRRGLGFVHHHHHDDPAPEPPVDSGEMTGDGGAVAGDGGAGGGDGMSDNDDNDDDKKDDENADDENE